MTLLRPFRGLSAVLPAVAVWALAAYPGQTVPPPGIREHTPQVHAFTAARIVTAPGHVIEQGTLVIRDGNIVAVGENVAVPSDARRWDTEGKTIYPGLIDLYSHYGLKGEQGARSDRTRDADDNDAPEGAPYWNPNITPEQSAARAFVYSEKNASKLRSQGVVLVLTVPATGVITGTGGLISTGDGAGNDVLVASDVALNVRFQTGGRGNENYPGSLMGVFALLRQSFLDADWYSKAHAAWQSEQNFKRPEQNVALARLAELRAAGTPLLMAATDEQALLRQVSLAREFGLPVIVRGSNYEYRRLAEVKATGFPLILPLDFPEVPAVKSPEEALAVSLQQLRHWYLAPANAGRLQAAGIRFAFTGDGLKDKGDMLAGVRKTVARGLSPDAALAALTGTPAEILSIAHRYGSLAPGKAASFVIVAGDLLDEEGRVLETWVDGRRYVVESEPSVDVRGTWDVRISGTATESDSLTLTLKGKASRPDGSLKRESSAKLAAVALDASRFSFTVKGDSLGFEGIVQWSAVVEPDQMLGNGVWSDGRRFTWTAARSADEPPDSTATTDSTATEKTVDEPAELELSARYPDGAFGFTKRPERPALIAFTNATIWTCGPQGRINNGTLLVAAGKVAGIGAQLRIPGDAVVVDAAGLHITPGLIDCHSHTAIEGDVNESMQTNSAEVRIGDVLDANDIAIYRELAGGLTVANLLHGSANAVGGHNQVIKLRWGGTADELKFKGAPPGIKFALGENPKQSNWGDRFTTRYPQTRMGVEEIIRDGFQAAREYEARQRSYGDKKSGLPPRRDLELDALAEVLAGERLIHCHSYRQDEIEMLMRLAEEYDFRVATFQHVLEGYKVADQMARHGAGGSCFSDWWAYKFEVYDAIPHNGALMHEQGVVVTFNSDSNELARRLNTEAAKAVKYGGVPPEEALKFVTINAARQLRIDDRVGSLEPGKDADFTIWSGDPLSTYTVCRQTWIDGRKYFDRAEDQLTAERDRTERAQLIQRALKEGGGKKGSPPAGGKPDYSCTYFDTRGGQDEAR